MRRAHCPGRETCLFAARKGAGSPDANARFAPRARYLPSSRQVQDRHLSVIIIIMGTSVSKWEDDAAAQEAARRAELDKVGRPPRMICALH